MRCSGYLARARLCPELMYELVDLGQGSGIRRDTGKAEGRRTEYRWDQA